MAEKLKIKTGSKLRIAFDTKVGETPAFNLVSTFNKALDDTMFLISIPMLNGKSMTMDENKKLLIRYGPETTGMILAGYPEEIVKDGIRNYWKIRRVTEQRQFFQRADERVKISLPLRYWQDTWPTNADGEIPPDDALTLDISAGGIAAYMGYNFRVGEICMITLPRVGTSSSGAAIEGIVAVSCWNREAPKGSPYKNICGFQFRYPDPADKDRVLDYVGYLKRKYAL